MAKGAEGPPQRTMGSQASGFAQHTVSGSHIACLADLEDAKREKHHCYECNGHDHKKKGSCNPAATRDGDEKRLPDPTGRLLEAHSGIPWRCLREAARCSRPACRRLVRPACVSVSVCALPMMGLMKGFWRCLWSGGAGPERQEVGSRGGTGRGRGGDQAQVLECGLMCGINDAGALRETARLSRQSRSFPSIQHTH